MVVERVQQLTGGGEGVGVRGLMTEAARSMTGPEISSFRALRGIARLECGSPAGPSATPFARRLPRTGGEGPCRAVTAIRAPPPPLVRSPSWDVVGKLPSRPAIGP